jgi:hypothetical protein
LDEAEIFEGHTESGLFDLVYARFLLTHLPDPSAALAAMLSVTVPGGIVVVEDIDFTGSFCWPENAAYARYVDLYSCSVQARGADPNIGLRLPELLRSAGLTNDAINVVQPAGITGESKLVTPITMENIADSVRAGGLADDAEIASVVRELYALAQDERTVMSLPRVVQAWGYVPA